MGRNEERNAQHTHYTLTKQDYGLRNLEERESEEFRSVWFCNYSPRPPGKRRTMIKNETILLQP